MPNYKDDVSNVSQTAGHVIDITGRIPRKAHLLHSLFEARGRNKDRNATDFFGF